MFELIRRAAARTRQRLVRLRADRAIGRHRRPRQGEPMEAPIRRLADPAPYPKHREPLRGEDHALVRPYMVAHEERVQRRAASRRRTLLIQPYLHLPEAG